LTPAIRGAVGTSRRDASMSSVGNSDTYHALTTIPVTRVDHGSDGYRRPIGDPRKPFTEEEIRAQF
jgi:hypothetical protein